MKEFIKKRSFLIVCLALFLFGLGLFVPGMMIGADNSEALREVKDKYDSAAGLGKRVVHDNEVARLKKNASQADDDLKKVDELAANTSNRPLIFEKVFPAPRPGTSQFYYGKFGENHSELINGLIRQLNGDDRPSEIEEKDAIEKAGEGSNVSRREGYDSYRPTMTGAFGRSQQNTNTLSDQLIFELRDNRAKNISIYCSTDAFCCYDYWKGHPGTGKTSLLQSNSWFTQLAYWIEQDVVLSILQINSNTASVKENPVKRLIEISFSGSKVDDETGGTYTSRDKSDMGIITRRRTDSHGILPTYVIRKMGGRDADAGITGDVTGANTGNITGNMVSSWTGHVSDETAHVVHFELGVIIDTTQVIAFMNALQSQKEAGKINQRNQITVLEWQMEPLEIEKEKFAGFHYGSGSLTTLRLICEYIFFREGYAKYMPKPVKKLFEEDEVASDSGAGVIKKPKKPKKRDRDGLDDLYN